MNGMTMMRSWMIIQTKTAITPTMTRTRHDQAPAMTMPRGSEGSAPRAGVGEVSVEGDSAAPREGLLRRIMGSV
ncbi:hypothetical protein FFA01_26600 [Frigoribacterium faeni]|uniref:Uncharacterized protein n=1 Tax=Frigoribacterium faeni TaxID=145483 RepID=A0ABQ0US96_9MICO|nr:hypothetical protein GCM10025699_61190 [Microbacterium flavescens]GEK84351.1 hypothetical protein FFA01_26600 [Frigoribacterium faeni]